MRPSEALEKHRDALRALMQRYNALNPRVFGSVLTGMDDEESDLDLLIDAGEKTSLFTLAALENEAETLLGVTVSVLTPGFLSTRFREDVLQRAQPL